MKPTEVWSETKKGYGCRVFTDYEKFRQYISNLRREATIKVKNQTIGKVWRCLNHWTYEYTPSKMGI